MGFMCCMYVKWLKIYCVVRFVIFFCVYYYFVVLCYRFIDGYRFYNFKLCVLIKFYFDFFLLMYWGGDR